MSVNWNGDALMDAIRRQAAEGLLAAAVFYERTLRQKVSTPSPFKTVKRKRDTATGAKGTSRRIYYDPSKINEYPKLRTGAGKNAITHQPTTVGEVVAMGDAMGVKVGYIEGDHHLLALEFTQKRKGLIDLLDEMRPQLGELTTGVFKG